LVFQNPLFMWKPKQICTFIDLTSLNSFDSPSSIEAFIHDALESRNKGFDVAAVCLYPNFAQQAKGLLKETRIKTAVVAGCFPSSQSFLSTRLHECEMALNAGADEIDIVLNIGAFDDGDLEQAQKEITAIKSLLPNKVLKVILETGYLKTEDRITKAAQLAIEGGADFIKTSTGKEFPGATIKAVETMAHVIKMHREKTGKTIGLKVSGGIRHKNEAIQFIDTVKDVLGNNFISPQTFRIGASSLLKSLLSNQQ
jgi:deoxyribose-phosphate aldolase